MDLSVPFRPEAVVFDLDGLLIDSEVAWERAERRVVEDSGATWDDAIRPALVGRSATDAARILAGVMGPAHGVEQVKRLVRDAVAEEFASGVRLRPGVLRLLDGLAGRVPVAIATNTERRLVDLLVVDGFAARFEAVITADDVPAQKPAPDPYVTAARACGADPGRCVAFEDSPVGALAARAAGMFVVGCPSTAGTELSAAHALVTSLEDVSAEALLAAG